MPLTVGDKCPQCHEGLLVRTELGLTCDDCSFEKEIAEVVEQNEREKIQAGDFVWKPKKFSIIIDEPDSAEEFLRGLILARQNNNSPYFVDLIDMVNEVLQPWRAAQQREQLRARDAGL